MFNLLKSDVYRLVHGKMLRIGLLSLALVVICGAVVLWFGTTPYFAEMVNRQAQENVESQGGVSTENDAELTNGEVQLLNEKVLPSRTYSYGNTFMVGFLGLIVSVLSALLAVSDFDTGFVKNVLAGRRNRLVYFGGKLVVIAAMCAVFLLAGVVLSDAAYAVAGFSYDYIESIGEFWGWLALSWLELTAYAYVVALIVWSSRSKAAGMVFAALIPTGFLESMLLAGAVGLAPAFPVVNDAVMWLPLSAEKLLAAGGANLLATSDTALAGMPVAGQVLLVFGAIAVVCATLSLTACRRKDV